MNEVSKPLFYTYHQNNSGGSFNVNDRVCPYVIIQAVSPRDADRRAEDIGIYFNGVNEGNDCPCCGDRWIEAWEDGTDQPLIYGQEPQNAELHKWVKEGEVWCRIYYLDGIIKEYKN